MINKNCFTTINECVLCGCLEFESAIKFCSIIMTIIYAIPTIFVNEIYVFVCLTPALISLIYLDIGLFRRKYSFMKQFIYVFSIYMVIEGVPVIIMIFACLINIDRDFKEVALFITLILIIIVGLELYYYFCTLSYIKSFGKELEKINEIRDLENNEKEIKT